MQQMMGQPGAGALGGVGAPAPAGDDGPDALAYALGGKLAALLLAGGYGAVAAVRAASDEALLAIQGISARRLQLIREQLT